jgi:hypothetical protein
MVDNGRQWPIWESFDRSSASPTEGAALFVLEEQPFGGFRQERFLREAIDHGLRGSDSPFLQPPRLDAKPAATDERDRDEAAIEATAPLVCLQYKPRSSSRATYSAPGRICELLAPGPSRSVTLGRRHPRLVSATYPA